MVFIKFFPLSVLFGKQKLFLRFFMVLQLKAHRNKACRAFFIVSTTKREAATDQTHFRLLFQTFINYILFRLFVFFHFQFIFI